MLCMVQSVGSVWLISSTSCCDRCGQCGKEILALGTTIYIWLSISACV